MTDDNRHRGGMMGAICKNCGEVHLRCFDPHSHTHLDFSMEIDDAERFATELLGGIRAYRQGEITLATAVPAGRC